MIYPMRHIVVGVADLQGEDPVLAAAMELAARTGAVLHMVHAYQLPSLAWDAYGRMGYMDQHSLDEYEVEVRARMRGAAEAHFTTPAIEYHPVAGPSAYAILDVAQRIRPDLIVVGATRRNALARAILGTTAQRVLRRADTPVLVLRQPPAWDLQRVLVTTDLSPFSAGVHELGLDALEAIWGDSRPEVRSLLVVGPIIGLPSPLPFEHLEEISYDELERFVGERRERALPITPQVRMGDPAEEIFRAVEEWKPDFLLLGTHARTTAERWLLGSVAEATLREVNCNALVIPGRAEEQHELPVLAANGTALTGPGEM